MRPLQPKGFLVAIAAVAILSACASKPKSADVHIQTRLDTISHGGDRVSNFCMMGTKTDLGGIATTPNIYQHAIGACTHPEWRKEDVIVLYFGDDGTQVSKEALAEELDNLMHPENYLSSAELATLDCTDGSECHANEALLRKGVIVHFASDSATPRSQEEVALVKRIAQIAQGKKVVLAVTGYTDSTSTPGHNMPLSLRRAEVIQKLLRANGMAAQFVLTDGRASSSPVSSNKTAEGRTQNRRTEIKSSESTGVNNGNAN